MTPRLSGHFSIFGLVFFVLKPPLGIASRWSHKKFAIKLRSHVRILICRTWAIVWIFDDLMGKPAIKHSNTKKSHWDSGIGSYYYFLNSIHLVPKSPVRIFTSILAYSIKLTENMHENISIVQPFSCSSAENRSKNTSGCCARSRARARARAHPRSLTHAVRIAVQFA